MCVFFYKQNTADEMRISDWSSDVCSTDPYSGERPLFDTANVDEEIARALSRRVDLKSGGYLFIDQTEALTTVDVNTGGFVGGRNFNDTIFKTNLEAAVSLARQLRLRNLGGIVILDFIDRSEEHTSELQSLMRISYAVFCLKKKKQRKTNKTSYIYQTTQH